MDTLTEEQFAKLPKFAQACITTLRRERETAIKALNEYCDSQTVAPFFIDTWESTGEQAGPSTKTRYIQSNRVEALHAGLRLTVTLQDDGIALQWRTADSGLRDIAMIPESFYRVRLVAKDNMR